MRKQPKGIDAMSNELIIKEELEHVDAKIAELENQVELGKAIEELHEHSAFNKVFIDGYFGDEAKRLFEVLTIPSKMKRDSMENIMDKLTAIRNLKDYIGVKLIEADTAENELEQLKEYRKEVTAGNIAGEE